ncbi:MAG: hypothetical protein STSR0009_10040 [Methanoregula sp.]
MASTIPWGAQVVSGNGGALGGAFSPADADPALTVQYPTGTIEKKDQTAGYLVVTVHPATRNITGIQKQYSPVNGTWATADRFTLSVSG